MLLLHLRRPPLHPVSPLVASHLSHHPPRPGHLNPHPLATALCPSPSPFGNHTLLVCLVLFLVFLQQISVGGLQVKPNGTCIADREKRRRKKMKVEHSYHPFWEQSDIPFSCLLGMMQRAKTRTRVADIQIPTPTISNEEDDSSAVRDGGIDVFDCVNVRKKRMGHKLLHHLSPRAVFSRLTKITRNRSPREAGGAKESGTVPSSSACKDHVDVSNVTDEPAVHPKEVDFEVSVGLGIFLLTAATCKSEINKMTRLRAEMEVMLESVKELVRKEDSSSLENVRLTTVRHDPSGQLPVSASAKFDRAKEMDRLEAELETELQRLEYRLTAEASPQQLITTEVNVEDTAPRESLSTMYGEQEGEKEAADMEGGVVAEELERRLREVKEVQQEERIKELEFSLQVANMKALENEREACMWRETAQKTLLFHTKEKIS